MKNVNTYANEYAIQNGNETANVKTSVSVLEKLVSESINKIILILY